MRKSQSGFNGAVETNLICLLRISSAPGTLRGTYRTRVRPKPGFPANSASMPQLPARGIRAPEPGLRPHIPLGMFAALLAMAC